MLDSPPASSWLSNRLLIIVCTILLVMLVLDYAAHARRPDISTRDASVPREQPPLPAPMVRWLPGLEARPLTCGQKQDASGTGFRLVGMSEQQVILQGEDMRGLPLPVAMQRSDFDTMFGGVWVTPLTPEQQQLPSLYTDKQPSLTRSSGEKRP